MNTIGVVLLSGNMSNLTQKQEIFVESMAEGKSMAAAARDAGYSEEVAKQSGFNLMKKPHVALAVEQRKHEIAEEVGLTMKDRFLMMKEVYARGLESDLPVAAKMVEHAAKVFGDYAPERSESINQNLNLNAVGLVDKYAREY